MATRILVLVLSSLILFVSAAGYSHSEIKAWCSQTPNPKPCEYFLTHNPKYKAPIKGKSDFFKVSSELALDRCMHAQSGLYQLGHKSRTHREKAAWADCIALYEDTIHRINNTVDPNVKCTPADVQTWLSTALTNLETCKAGFVEFGINDYDAVFPIMSNNVSLLLSNTLALNEGAYSNYSESSPSYKQGFPSWVRPGERKLLQSSSPKANIVVAQDGSGNFKTVGAAVAAAGKRSGSGRYVIYVKQGSYKENVDIGKGLKNIMLLGDGIGKTIITGSRSVDGGSTTFKSATVCKSNSKPYIYVEDGINSELKIISEIEK